MSAQTDLAPAGAARAGPADKPSAAGAAGATAGPDSAGRSGSLLATVVHPRLSFVIDCRARQGATCVTPSLGHTAYEMATFGYVPDSGHSPGGRAAALAQAGLACLTWRRPARGAPGSRKGTD